MLKIAVATRRLLALAVLTILAGCGDAPDEQTSDAAPEQAFIYPASDYFEQAPGKPGGTLKVSVALDTGSLDLHAISHTNAQWLGRLIYDNLVYLDDQGRITPWLAKAWEVSEDGKTYTFHLRDDVTFSDGAKFNAEAVRINLEHMRAPATKSPLAAAYIAPYIDGEVVDEYTFRANLREPYAPFLNVLAQSWLSMQSPKAIVENPKALAEAPVGSGPFVVERYTRQQGIRLVRRDDYAWAPDFLRHQGPAYLERIELTFVPESMIRYSSLLGGQHDFTLDAPTQNAAAIRANPELVLHSRIRKGNPFRSVTFNTERFPFDDVRVRKALTQAIDREGLAWVIGFGEYQTKSDYLAINTRFYDPSFTEALKYDPQAAARLLDEAGWSERDADGIRIKDGQRLSVKLLMSENPAFPSSVAVAIQSDARKAGIQIELDVLPLAQITERRYAGDYQLLGGGYWHSNTPDGLFMLYHSASIPTDKLLGQNVGRLRDETLDRLLSEARRSIDPERLQQLYSQAQQRLTELVPAAPSYESHHIVAHQAYVKGLIFDTSHNTPFFTSVWLDKERP